MRNGNHMRRMAVMAMLAIGAAAPWTTAAAWTPYLDDQRCNPELNEVGGAIEAATYTGQRAATDKVNLLSKLDAAHAKVGLAKYSDALDKLYDIQLNVERMIDAGKPKIAADSATRIFAALGPAYTCVGALK